MVVFEDLHWIDGETQAFLNLLTDSIGTAKLLLLATYRPELSHQWSNKTYYTQLRLDPLGKESAGEMFDAVLGESIEVGQLKRLIIEKTEGTPFFIEETIQELFEDGTLIHDRSGQTKITRSLNQLRIPTTVHSMLASRIDRLPAGEKELLQILSVIGTQFPLRLAAEVTGKPEPDLTPMLSSLQQREFIYEQLTGGDIEYTFKHALTHDVAYNSILNERRKLMHERVATAIGCLWRDHIDDHLEELAHHYSNSGDTDNAVSFLLKAGILALRRGSYQQSIERFSAG